MSAPAKTVPHKAVSSAPDWSHIEHWLFDLDNTLYSAGAGLLDSIEDRICRFVERELNLPREEAWKVQKDYFRRYGTTLSGLMGRHGTDPEDYLAFVNDIELDLEHNARLVAGIERLPGRRIVFTSNCGRHAQRVLEHLAIDHLFDDILDIRTTGFVAKPLAAAYDAALRRGAFTPQRSAMFDDIAANLEIPAKLGMTTVWLRTKDQPRPAHVHHETDNLGEFLHTIEFAESK